MDRVILHCDMNNFYASVEQIFDPSLRGKCIAVCGDEEERHGIVLAKSQEAKVCGVATGDPIWSAREKCPSLVVVPPHYERYVKYSRLARKIYCEYTDLVESFGLDECWLDVTASRRAFGDGVGIADKLRERMKKELGLTISVGVSWNKIFAKLGSDLKKPDAVTVIDRKNYAETVLPLKVEMLLGVGEKTRRELCLFGMDTIGKLAEGSDWLLKSRLGKNGLLLKAYAKGEDSSPVIPASAAPPAKSIGHGLTVRRDLTEQDEVRRLILLLTQEVGRKLRRASLQARGIEISCKDRTFAVHSHQRALPFPTDCTAKLAKEAYDLFCERHIFDVPLRSVTVRAIRLEPSGAGEQLSFLEDRAMNRERILDRTADRLRERYGKDILKAATLLETPLSDSHGYIPFRGTEEEVL